jgi:hypothetical protein
MISFRYISPDSTAHFGLPIINSNTSELWIYGHAGEENRNAAVGICTKGDQRDAA